MAGDGGGKTGPVERPSDEQVVAWYPRLFRTALRMTGCAEVAADLTQQAFCKAIGRWEQFDGRGMPTTWLHSILVNCVRDWMRARQAHADTSMEPWMLTAIQDPAHGAREELEKREKLGRLRQEIQRLPGKLQGAFVAVVLDGYTYREAARMLSVPVGTIGSRVNDARGRLHAAMRRGFPEV